MPQVETRGRPRGWSSFLLVALLLHIPLFAYPVLRLCAWFGLGPLPTLALFLPLFFNQIIARLLLRNVEARWARWVRLAADTWLGMSPVVLALVLLAEVPVALGWVQPSLAAAMVCAGAAALVVHATLAAWSPVVVTVRLASHKLRHPVRFVQISDVHIGSRTARFLRASRSPP